MDVAGQARDPMLAYLDRDAELRNLGISIPQSSKNSGRLSSTVKDCRGDQTANLKKMNTSVNI